VQSAFYGVKSRRKLMSSHVINLSPSHSCGGIFNSSIFAFSVFTCIVVLELQRQFWCFIWRDDDRLREKPRGRKAASGETPHMTFNLDDNTVRYHIYSQYYVSCKYDIFTLSYLRAYVTRLLESAMQRLLCMQRLFVCHCASHHRVTINSAAITRSVDWSIDRNTRDDSWLEMMIPGRDVRRNHAA